VFRVVTGPADDVFVRDPDLVRFTFENLAYSG
jgi:hypothetical protein